MIVAALAAAGLIALMLRRQWQTVAEGPQRAEPRILAEHVVEKVSTHAADGAFRYVSSVFAGLLGEYPGSLSGRHPREFAHPDDHAALDGFFKRVMLWGGTAASVTWRCRRHDGEYEWLETTGRVASHEAAELGAIVCANRVVTERKQIEDALRDSEQRFRTTLESVRLVAVGLDPSGRVTFCNEAFLALTGWTRTELIGENWFDKVVPQDDPARVVFQDNIGTGEIPLKQEATIICRDGSRRLVEWDTTVLRSPSGDVLGTASLGADVTERRRHEARLLQARDDAEKANRAKSDFLSRMSHELRTPLNSVIGFANVMKKNKGGRLSDEDLVFLDRIISNGRHLLTLVNNVLDISKVEAGRLTVTTSMVALDELIKDVVAQLEGQPRGAGVALKASVPDDMIPIESDHVLLRQVLINLTSNALKFTQAGSVVVSAEADAEGQPLRVTVKDTGIGIAPDRLQAIFEPFEQAEADTHRRFGGSGLGLSISKAICEALGYTMVVTSYVGAGSTFTVELNGTKAKK
jgi:PAS domain S-box-containing protein